MCLTSDVPNDYHINLWCHAFCRTWLLRNKVICEQHMCMYLTYRHKLLKIVCDLDPEVVSTSQIPDPAKAYKVLCSDYLVTCKPQQNA